MEEETTIIMQALSTLTPPTLSNLTYTILSLTHRHHHRLSSLLSSSSLFSLTLHHLHSLSFPHKTLLIARYLLFSLHHLTLHFQPLTVPLLHPSTTLNNRDLDSVLLLFLLCETHQHDPDFLQTPFAEWRGILNKHRSDTMLTLAGIGVYNGGVLIPYVEMVSRCWKFIGAMDCGGKEGREVAATTEAMVALPSMEVRGGGVECVICKEEMSEGRDVCEFPCEHLFHWICILPWLKKRNTCPCCRFQLPTDDVFGEIQRLWRVLIKVAGRCFD
ncbi:zf-RING_2 domain-containing protein [Cephalotus follicularis]|uniref:RING-type E3 ubiquitin transferase n=1 Tax=Cephalotus follicularis TaxID=3775 RepID=A0A1Q3BAK1_CEPFO|nr:zf-RING_2 domain-containing protein [Cephalotus follicularis]